MITLRLAIRNVFRHRTRSVITLAAIAFGCTAIIFVGGFFEDILYRMQESYIKAHTGHLQIYTRGFFDKGSARPFSYLIDHPDDIIALVKKVPGVVSVARRLQFSGLLSTGENTVSCFGQGVEPDYEPSVRLTDRSAAGRNVALLGGAIIESGEPLNANEPYHIILGRGLAKGIDAKPGDGLILVSHTIAGSINAIDATVAGIFYTTSKAFDDYAVRLPLGTTQQLLQTESVQSLVVMLRRTSDTDRVKLTLRELFVQRHLSLEVKAWQELNDEYGKSKAFLWRMFLILKAVVATIVILSIYNTMNMAVVERTSEIGTIMALGTTRQGVWQLFLLEGATLGLIGGCLGIAIGTAITLLIRHVGIPMPPPPGASMSWISEPVIVPSVLVFSFVLSLITSLISSFFPAYQASRLSVADALRHA
ncbi:MAG: ABC transporter permease [Candidatus Omnitrophica bacterium]|nr:ABC transporter permease [Candidatus Omnitrophota bacterium]